MRPDRDIDYLGVTGDELLDLVRSGSLPRPANWGGGRVAWRRDEVFACGDRRTKPDVMTVKIPGSSYGPADSVLSACAL